MRLAARIAAMAAGLILCLPLHYLWKLAGRRSPWPRLFLAWVARSAGMRMRIEGSPLSRDVLFLANHRSWLDILLVAGATGAAFVSKDEVARWPLVGWLASLNATIFVARSARGAVRDQADALREALSSGQPVALFPEGTTAGDAEPLPFRASLLASLFPPLPGLCVQPLAIDYGAATGAIAWVGREPALANARRILARPGTTQVTLRFLPPVAPEDLGNRKALAKAARTAIAASLRASGARGDAL